ncbi:hypothetical protein PtA15_12A289 [Puccinia triticina]|uniref:Uncharacterized protein n=1 Tax=Puccinia triticina TaxID=208348 RepID=A0ABY7CYL9_9BASI|nr:uncharacterized protein PtA15_12A289 [Puccinia triticina]WAQ90301.1 hypothetical protein PtA15_12A289 [Puccinia triticina]
MVAAKNQPPVTPSSSKTPSRPPSSSETPSRLPESSKTPVRPPASGRQSREQQGISHEEDCATDDDSLPEDVLPTQTQHSAPSDNLKHS